MNEPQTEKGNWKLSLAMLIMAFASVGLATLIINENWEGRHVFVGQVIAMIGISLIATVWYGHMGVKNSSARFQRIKWYENLVFILAVLGTISGCAWLLLGIATLNLSGSASVIMLIGVLAISGLLWGVLALLAGLVSCVMYRWCFFLYFIAQIVFIAFGWYWFGLISSL